MAETATPTGDGQANFANLINKLIAQYPMQQAIPTDPAELAAAAPVASQTSVAEKPNTAAAPSTTKAAPTSSPSGNGGPQTLTDGILNIGQIMPVIHAMATPEHMGDLEGLLNGKTKFADTGLGKAAAMIEKIGPMLAGL